MTGGQRIYPWVVFGLAFVLLLSDYMSRQVLSAVFPFLKAEWALSDSRLAALNSVVALMVGLLTFPLSLLADRWGRVKSLVLMAIIWSVATLLCAVAVNYGQLLGARFLVGVGEAAYGSVGIAVVLSMFPPHLRASLSGALMAGGSFGSVIGVALGGVIAVQLSWRWSFTAVAIFGLLLVVLFRVFVTQTKVDRYQHGDTTATSGEPRTTAGYRAPLTSLFSIASVNCAYIGSGLQLFVAAVLPAWIPSFLNRYHAMTPDRAGAVAAIFVLLIGVGMIVCGIVTDRLSHEQPTRKWTTAASYSLLAAALLIVGFNLDAGGLQLVLIGAGAFFSAGASGPATAMVANLTHPSIRATGFGSLTLVNSLLGLALGPFVVGVLADRLGLLEALRLAPLAYIGAVAALLIGKRCYPAGTSRLTTLNQSLSA
ncbi:MFS family permease [Kibdelosporangium banguiense]|uniref:MFS family permease n=1 Tax=Kibdelosporangium banguiense TaxID=1365924 RepID=A0ABS4TWG1_9PSEU|nr:MFS transporter [Kibdelosporangium banguiense]MBP2328737.1 MFS family permease [Kibdelosporangium banguiense]